MKQCVSKISNKYYETGIRAANLKNRPFILDEDCDNI